MRETVDAALVQRVAKAAVEFFRGRRQGSGRAAEQIAALSGLPEAAVQRVFDEHWGIASVRTPRLNMTKAQYERIQHEAAHGVVLAPSVSCDDERLHRTNERAQEPASEPDETQRPTARRKHLLDALAREVDAASLPQHQKEAARQLLRRLAELVGPVDSAREMRLLACTHR